MFRKRTYLDYASLTPIDSRVMREMETYAGPTYGNPSSLYKKGTASKKALSEMRKKVADSIHAHADEIVFTSGGTEANILAVQGVVVAARKKGIHTPHILISAIEHSSIIEVAELVRSYGCEVSRISVDQHGVINLDELKKAIKPTTVLVSIMTVNNEVGTIQPLKEIAHIIRKARSVGPASADGQTYPIFHTDAAQAFMYQELFVEKLGVDLMTLDSSKVYGPRGVGCLFVRRGIILEPFMVGGGQESGLRSGTENIPSIAGFARALELASSERVSEVSRIAQLRALFIEQLNKHTCVFTINGAELEFQSPHILNISLPGIDNEFFLFQLDARGIACSTKSSCLRDEEESYVLKAMKADSKTSLRFSYGRWTKKGDIRRTVRAIADLVHE